MFPPLNEEATDAEQPIRVQSLGSIIRKTKQRVSNLTVDPDDRLLACHPRVPSLKPLFPPGRHVCSRSGIIQRSLSHFHLGRSAQSSAKTFGQSTKTKGKWRVEYRLGHFVGLLSSVRSEIRWQDPGIGDVYGHSSHLQSKRIVLEEKNDYSVSLDGGIDFKKSHLDSSVGHPREDQRNTAVDRTSGPSNGSALCSLQFEWYAHRFGQCRIVENLGSKQLRIDSNYSLVLIVCKVTARDGGGGSMGKDKSFRMARWIRHRLWRRFKDMKRINRCGRCVWHQIEWVRDRCGSDERSPLPCRKDFWRMEVIRRFSFGSSNWKTERKVKASRSASVSPSITNVRSMWVKMSWPWRSRESPSFPSPLLTSLSSKQSLFRDGIAGNHGECVLHGFLSGRSSLSSSLIQVLVRCFRYFSLYGHAQPVLCLDISFDSRLVIIGSSDRNIKIWGLDFGDCHRSFFAHDDTITAIQFVPKTHLFFSASKDNKVKCWDADKFLHIQTLQVSACLGDRTSFG